MSNKARRRPSWKKVRRTDTWTLDLICDETNELLETIHLSHGGRWIKSMIRTHGYQSVHDMILNNLIAAAQGVVEGGNDEK